MATASSPITPDLGTGRLRDLVRRPLLTCPPDLAIRDAARLMAERDVGSIVVTGADGVLRGIVTDSDLRRRVVAAGMAGDAPVERVMSAPLIAVDADTLLFEAVHTMLRHRVHHLVVVDGGAPLGMVADMDLLGVQRHGPLFVQRSIEQARSLDDLLALDEARVRAIRWLVQARVGAWDVARIVAELNDALARRLLALAAAEFGPPPVAYCWLGLGSEGRREQALKTDQDNALVYADPPPALAETTVTYFGRLAGWVVDALARCGLPRCPGEVMASNPRWCQPLAVWRAQFARWVQRPEPEALLHAAIFFDLRAVAGDAALAEALRADLRAWIPRAPTFITLLLRDALERRPPLGFFRNFVVERTSEHAGAFDIKARGIMCVTETARVNALAEGIDETNTVERLQLLRERGALPPSDADDLVAAYTFLLDLRLRHHLAQLDAGEAPDNFILPARLGRVERRTLKEHFRVIADMQAYIESQCGRALAG